MSVTHTLQLFDADRSGVSRYVDSLTGVRGLAAAMVMLFHAWTVAGSPSLTLVLGSASVDLTPLVAMGWLGVDLFFVLSGCVLTLPAATRDPDAPSLGMGYGRFLRRRALRVLPAFYVNLLLILPFAGYGLMRTHPETADVVSKLLLAHNLIPAYGASINGVYWSLPVEWNFYLVLPLLLPLVVRRRLALAVAGVVGSMYLFAAYFEHYLADHWITLAGRPLSSAAIALLLVGCAGGARGAARLLGNRGALFAGLISYSLYLWHLPVALVVAATGLGAHAQGGTRFAVLAAAIVPIASLVAYLSYALVERPFLFARRGLAPGNAWQAAVSERPLAVLAGLAIAAIGLQLALVWLRQRALLP